MPGPLLFESGFKTSINNTTPNSTLEYFYCLKNLKKDKRHWTFDVTPVDQESASAGLKLPA
jgi:hypothetical protein